MAQSPRPNGKKPLNIIFRLLGPGLVTGAADDDPSGIATYSQAGAQFGYGLLWTVFLTTPFMIAIQLVSAQIGRVTGKGLADDHVPRFPTVWSRKVKMSWAASW
jgi:Mn2+/Fe2+ NRAMP family transporter